MKKLFNFILTFAFLQIYAQQTPELKHPIDLQTEICENNAMDTHSAIRCGVEAEEAWDKELNKNYNQLKKELKPDSFKKLQDSQRKWLAWRDTEFEFFNDFFVKEVSGSMYYVVASYKRAEIVKARAFFLSDYLRLLKEGGVD